MKEVRGLLLSSLATSLIILACGVLTPAGGNAATPTPTGQISAVERSTPGSRKDLQVWTGTITSQTSRQFVVNGSPARTCTTNWVTDIDFVVDASGTVSGTGQAMLSEPRACVPTGNLVGNTQSMTMTVAGQRLSTGFDLKLAATEFLPPATGDFGGYVLLEMDGACPGNPRDLSVPSSGAAAAEAQLSLNGVMTGCGGSQNDTMSNQSLVKLQFRFKCSEMPADLNDPTIQQLCQ